MKQFVSIFAFCTAIYAVRPPPLNCPLGTQSQHQSFIDHDVDSCGPLHAKTAGNLEGPFRKVYKSGQLWEQGQYHQGLKTGVWKTWYTTAERASLGSYENGMRQGEWSFWDNRDEGSGLAVRGSFEKDQKTGEWLYFYSAMKLVQLVPYVQGKREGVWKNQTSDGKILTQGQYSQDEPRGEWKRFDCGGKVKEVVRYDGKKVRSFGNLFPSPEDSNQRWVEASPERGPAAEGVGRRIERIYPCLK